MIDRSPAAQAVLNAAMRDAYGRPSPVFCHRLALALEAVAEHLEEIQWEGRVDPDATVALGIHWSQDALRSVAAELEALIDA